MEIAAEEEQKLMLKVCESPSKKYVLFLVNLYFKKIMLSSS